MEVEHDGLVPRSRFCRGRRREQSGDQRSRQPPDLRTPRPAVCEESVEQDQRRPIAGGLVRDLQSVSGDGFHRSLHFRRRSTRMRAWRKPLVAVPVLPGELTSSHRASSRGDVKAATMPPRYRRLRESVKHNGGTGNANAMPFVKPLSPAWSRADRT